MAEQAAEPRQRRTPLRTDEDIHNSYGQAIAKKVLEGEAPFQRATSMPSPETPGVKSYSFTTADGVERKTNPQPARVYGTAKGQFLRAYAERHGIENPQFVSRQKATSLLRAAGETGHIKPAAKGAKTIMLPRNSSATNMPVVLEKDGPNFNAKCESVKGKKGDVQHDKEGRPVTTVVQFGPAADDPPLNIATTGEAWKEFQRQSKPNLVMPLSQSNARAEPIARPTAEEGREAFAGMLKTASEKWNVTFVDDKKGQGFSRETVKSPDGEMSERSVVSLPPFDAAKAGKRGSAWKSEDEYVTRVAVEVGHACAYHQATRDPAARPDPLDAQKAGDKSRQTAAFAREDMVSNMAAMEFVTGAGRKFTPAPQEEKAHMREAQAHALAEPGGYSKVTYNASRSLRMLNGNEPTRRDDSRARKTERFADKALGMDAIDLAAQGLPDLGAPLTKDAGRDVGAERPTKPSSTPSKEPSRDRTTPTPG